MTGQITTSSCLCGAVKLSFSLSSDQIVAKFLCHCTDDRKITGSMFASNLILHDTTLVHLNPANEPSIYTKTAESGHIMTSHFCPTCGTTMYRRSSGFPGMVVLKIGTIDDLKVHDALRPEVEQFLRTRVAWLGEVEGATQEAGNFYC